MQNLMNIADEMMSVIYKQVLLAGCMDWLIDWF